MNQLINLVHEYATAKGAAERHHALLECLVDDEGGFLAGKIAEYETAATARHAQLMTAYDELTRTTVRAVPDERLPVSTRQHGVVEVRGVLPDATRNVRVSYSPAQAIVTGTALIACAALADGDTGGTLTPILPHFPDTVPGRDSTAAGATGRAESRVATGNPDLTARGDGMSDGQHALPASRLTAALTLIGELDPVIATVLQHLHLRVYPGDPADGDRSDYIVLDLHGVSIGARRREHDFYLHADTTETNDRIIAVEVNGSGEHDHPTH